MVEAGFGDGENDLAVGEVTGACVGSGTIPVRSAGAHFPTQLWHWNQIPE